MQATYMSYAQVHFELETNTKGFYTSHISCIHNSTYGAALQLVNTYLLLLKRKQINPYNAENLPSRPEIWNIRKILQ